MADTKVYLSGGRIQGRSDDSVTTNATVTYTQLYENSSDSNIGITGSSTYFNVDSTVADALYFDPRRSGTNYAQTWDVGATLSETAWVLRFKVNITSLDNSGDTCRVFYGMSSITHDNGAGGTHNFIGTTSYINSSNAFWYRLSTKGNGLDVGEANTYALTSTTLYIEIIRKTETTYSVRWTTSSDYTGGTIVNETVGSNGGSGSTSSMNLRYFWVSNINVSGNSDAHIQGNIEDVRIYNGVTSFDVVTAKDKTTITNVPVGTRYEETDTRKIYRMATVPNVKIDFDAGGEATAGNWTHPTTDSGGNSGAHGFSITTESSLTGKAGTIDITGRDWDSTIDMVTHCGLATALPAQTKFVIDWDFYRHSDDTSDHPVFAFSSEAHGVDPRGGNSSKEVAWACEQNNQDDSGNDGQNSVKLYCKNSSGTSYGNTITVSGDSTSLQSKGETRYWRCIYGETASTYLSVRLQRYDTAANRTAGGATGRELNLVSTGWASAAAQAAWEAGDPIRYFTLLTYNNGQKAFSIDNITWYDDSLTAVANVPSWVEKGTA